VIKLEAKSRVLSLAGLLGALRAISIDIKLINIRREPIKCLKRDGSDTRGNSKLPSVPRFCRVDVAGRSAPVEVNQLATNVGHSEDEHKQNNILK